MTDRTRAEHLAWCKQRALEYLNAGDAAGRVNAVASFLSDLGKHRELENHVARIMGATLICSSKWLADPYEIRQWIEGTN